MNSKEVTEDKKFLTFSKLSSFLVIWFIELLPSKIGYILVRELFYLKLKVNSGIDLLSLLFLYTGIKTKIKNVNF